jgi:hypothetical protein
MINSPGLVSESCHESTFKLIRHHNFNDVLFSVGATWTSMLCIIFFAVRGIAVRRYQANKIGGVTNTRLL